MVGAVIPVLEIEKLKISEDGRGIILKNDATNFVIQSASPWTGISSQGAGSSKKFFATPSSLGWLKIHYVSGSTYGATGATCYIPLYRNLNTNIA
jgi:hypothetical protein